MAGDGRSLALCKSDSLLCRLSWSSVLNCRAQSKQVIASVSENSNSVSVGAGVADFDFDCTTTTAGATTGASCFELCFDVENSLKCMNIPQLQALGQPQ